MSKKIFRNSRPRNTGGHPSSKASQSAPTPKNNKTTTADTESNTEQSLLGGVTDESPTRYSASNKRKGRNKKKGANKKNGKDKDSNPAPEKEEPGITEKIREKINDYVTDMDPVEVAKKSIEKVKKFMEPGYEFSEENGKLRALLHLKPDDDVAKALQAQARSLADKTELNNTQAVQAQETIASMGPNAEAVLALTPPAVIMSQVNQKPVKETAEMLLNLKKNFKLDNKQYPHIGDISNSIIQETDIDFDDFNKNMEKISPDAHKAGVSFEGTSLLLGSLANNNITGDDAEKTAKSIIHSLSQQGNQAKTALKKLNVSPKNSHGSLKSPMNTIGEINDAFEKGKIEKKDRDNYIRSIFGEDQKDNVNALIKDYQDGKTAKLKTIIDKSDGNLDDSHKTMKDNLAGDISDLKSSMESLQVDLYQKAEKKLRTGVQYANDKFKATTSLLQSESEDDQEKSDDDSTDDVNTLSKALNHSSEESDDINEQDKNTPEPRSKKNPNKNKPNREKNKKEKKLRAKKPLLPKAEKNSLYNNPFLKGETSGSVRSLLKNYSKKVPIIGEFLSYYGEIAYDYYEEHPEQKKFLSNNYLFGNEMYELSANEYLDKHQEGIEKSAENIQKEAIEKIKSPIDFGTLPLNKAGLLDVKNNPHSDLTNKKEKSDNKDIFKKIRTELYKTKSLDEGMNKLRKTEKIDNDNSLIKETSENLRKVRSEIKNNTLEVAPISIPSSIGEKNLLIGGNKPITPLENSHDDINIDLPGNIDQESYRSLITRENSNYIDNSVTNNNVYITMPEGTQVDQLREKILETLNESSRQKNDRHLNQMTSFCAY
ncbi:phage tail tape measure protein [Dickeya lacustris]|uniref:Phage tail tape measure protein n=1 Tax=Dickeya lacustris TaxID=2259638 RepID=A0ABY8G901_9GAMM|nr:phage tail tape measure protein [Dickeya lacustris]WFN56384.1 phage tail tape measure protein [Dickeya lacustris]